MVAAMGFTMAVVPIVVVPPIMAPIKVIAATIYHP
jgi:hypothetical protein